MKQVLHKARGVVALTVVGAYPERFLNALAAQNILFWGAEPVDPTTLRLKIHARDRKKTQALAARLLCEATVEKREGLPFFLFRLRRRYALMTGLFLSAAAVLFFSQFILTVEVEGNETVPTAVILAELRRQGVRPGVFGPALDEGAAAQEALLNLKDLSWMAVNLYGTRAQVLVRERSPKPELEDSRDPADVVAEATGIILHFETWNGTPLFREGDTVVAGDVLISGWVPVKVPEYSQITDAGGRAVRSEGRIEARTWRTLTASLPLETRVKECTGREKRFYALDLLGKRVNFYRNTGISFAEYDKITEVHPLTLPGGRTLPFRLVVETIRETEHLSAPIDKEGAAGMLEEQLCRRLAALIGEEGEVLKSEVSVVEENGLLTVRLLAECREEIGKTVDWIAPEYPGAGQQ